MEFSAKTITVQTFLTDRKYKIPRYQREYSWGKEQLDDFYSDIVSNIKQENGSYITQDYFFGTVILVGNMEKLNESIEIIDGQQRITTITILLSALSNVLYTYDENLSTLLWKYIIAQDNDGNLYTVLENETAAPYFQQKIQSRDIKPQIDQNKGLYLVMDRSAVDNMEKELSNEAKCIKEAYNFFKNKLENDDLSATIFNNSNMNKVDKLKLIRDQLLRSKFVYIISEKVNDVNIIFENINSKGIQLSALDLIKNEIFSVQNTTIPIDDAKCIWSNIRENLRNNGEYISIQKFYRYFWLSRYTSSTEKDLYKNFKKHISEEKYLSFLQELERSSKQYANIIRPKEDYFRRSSKGNNVGKVDLERFIYSLKVLQDILDVEQVQVLLLTLVNRYYCGKLSFKNMKSIVIFLEEFHFIYNGVMKERTNALVSKYGKTARKIYKAKDQQEILKIFEALKREFIALLPDDNAKFKTHFIQMSYSSKKERDSRDKNQDRKNMLTRYSIYKLEEILSEKGNSSFDNISATIEHIIPESKKDSNTREMILNIGNLMILEKKLNEECEAYDLKDKLSVYEKSNYCSVRLFLNEYLNSEEYVIEHRAKSMGDLLYSLIIEKWKGRS